LTAGAVDLVRNGTAEADIVVATNALPQVTFAARELQEHLQKISGAVLPIVAAPGSNVARHVYVGESAFTRQLGLGTNDLAMEGFRIVATHDSLVLLGRDAVFPFYPRGHRSPSDQPRLLKEWQVYAGQPWDFPWLALYDPRFFSPELGFSLFDPSGTLFAVYDLLEQLGVRWYMPYREYGTVIPSRKDIVVEPQSIARNPAFSKRFMRFTLPKGDPEGFLWFKRQKLGVSEMTWDSHGTPNVTHGAQKAHPEYFALVGGKPVIKKRNSWLPRLAPPLRDALIQYGNTFLKRYPELRYVSASPADAFTSIDDRDAAAGWLREDRGAGGRLSDYVWHFVNGVAAGVGKKHPDKIVMGLAYSYYRLPPASIDALNHNVGVTYCQHRADMYLPHAFQEACDTRDAWLKKLRSGEFFVWEYYLWHNEDSQLWGVPVMFTKTLQADLRYLRGKSKGEFVEAWSHGKRLWGLNHLTYYLQARLYWDPDLDVDKFLDAYYADYYGPARAEMKEFFTFAEEVWMRPDSRQITLTGGFLKPEDIDRFFEILGRARTKAGDSVHGQRIDLIHAECQPMREIYAKLKRTGPDFLAPRVTGKPLLDGDLNEPFWMSTNGTFHAPFYSMRNLKTGQKVQPGSTVLLRWAEDYSGLYVAVSCEEPQMKSIVIPRLLARDSFSIYDGDTVELFLETENRSTFRAAINPDGVIYDACTDSAVQPGGPAWNPDWTVAVKKEANQWNVELFIPRDSLDHAGVPSPKHPWGINVCRSRFVTGKAENSTISPTGAGFFVTTKFGNIVIP
jgi:hypothetical protein